VCIVGSLGRPSLVAVALVLTLATSAAAHDGSR